MSNTVAPPAPVPAAAEAVAQDVAIAAKSVEAVPGGNPIAATVAQDVAAAATDVADGKGISNVAASLIRTAVPALVGAGLAALGTVGFHVPAAYEPVIDSAGAFVLGTGYYAAVRLLEVKYPKSGWLLGIAKKPVYGA